MATEVIMPALGMAQDSGLLMAWLKQEGETVRKGEPLMEVETDKATVEIEADDDGVLMGVTAQAGDTVPVGTVIAYIVAAGASLPTAPVQAPLPVSQRASPGNGSPLVPTPVAARVAGEHHINLQQVPSQGPRITKSDVLAYINDSHQPGRRRSPSSPLARQLAREAGLDPLGMPGSGPDGALVAVDVRSAIRNAAVVPSVISTPPVTEQASPEGAAVTSGRRWLSMAVRMQSAWQTVPHFYLMRELDATHLLAWRARANERAAEKVTVTDLLIKAVAAALRRHPRLNASWIDGDIVTNESINIGLAVAVDDGLLVPVIANADQLGTQALAVARRELVERTLADRLRPADLQGGTFTLSNLGMYHVDAFNAIVTPPQAAILAVGQIAEKIVPFEGQPVIRPMITLSLSCDHRVIDGARGAAFLDTMAQFIQDPLALLD